MLNSPLKNQLLLLGLCATLHQSSNLFAAQDYDNFSLPKDPPVVAVPDEAKLRHSSARVQIMGRTRVKEPSLKPEQFLFAKEAYVTEKRDEAIKLLRQEMDTGYKANRDNMLLRLGQLYTEKYMELSYRESELYNQMYQAYDKKREAGQKVQAPTLDNSRSKHYLKESLKVFYSLEKEYPKHPRLDEITYFIGFVEMESGNKTKGKTYLERILSRHPGSKKYEEAAVYLADYYFDQHKFKDASQKYKLLVTRGSGMKDYARYKLAWCDLNLGSPDKALRDMKNLVVSLGNSPDTARFNLREQALKDLVVFYGDTDSVDDAINFFSQAQGKTKALENLRLLADVYRSKARDEAAIRAYSRLIKEFPSEADTPRLYLGLYECQTRLGKSAAGTENLMQLMDRFGANSDWAKNVPKEKAEDAKDTLNTIAQEAEKAAFFHHQAGQKSANKGHYAMAIKIYSGILKNFPEYPNRKKIAFFRGEALFSQGQWLEAADAYMIAAQIAPKDKVSDEAVYNALLATDKLTEKSAKLERYSKEDLKNKDLTAKEIPIPEKKFIEIGQYYLKEYPQGERVVDVKFRIASIYYQYQHFDEAQEGFKEVALNSPKHRSATTAAHIVLDIYNIKKDFTALNSTALAFASNPNLGDAAFKSEMKQLTGEISFKQIEPLERDSKWSEAAVAYYNFYQANPSGNLAEKSLYNAYIAYEKAGDVAKTAEMAKLFAAKYPTSGYTEKITLNLAKLAEKQYDFEAALKLYKGYYDKFPKEKESLKALYNAAVFSEMLEKNKEAGNLYDEYMKVAKPRGEERKDILISQAKLYRKQGNWDKVTSIYRTLARDAESVEGRLGYFAELAKQYERAGKNTEKQNLLKEMRAIHASHKGKNLGYAAQFIAEAELTAIEPQRKKYQEIKLRFPADDLLYLMKRKEKALTKLAQSYDGVVDLGVPEWGVAALFNKSDAYMDFVTGFRAVKIPKSLKPEERADVEKSLAAIDKQVVVPLENKAQEYLKVCVAKAAEFHVANDYSLRCQKLAKKDGPVPMGLVPQPNYWSLRAVGEGIAKR